MVGERLMNWEDELRHLGVYDRALAALRDQGAKEAVRQVRAAFLSHCKASHPDLNKSDPAGAEANMRRLNAIKERIDQVGPGGLNHYLAGQMAAARAGAKVLLVEHDGEARGQISYWLHQHGYRVRSAANGVQGMSAHFSFKPDLVITGVLMPLMDGVSMASHLINRRKDLKVIFISSHFGQAGGASGLIRKINAMGCPMLHKPVGRQKLFQLMEQLLKPEAGQVVS
jgi:CheY-like chemotaxis protein